MIGFENFFHLGKRLGVLRLFVPGQIEQPVRIVAKHGIFGRGGRHLVHAGKLLHRLFLHRRGHLFGKELFPQQLVLLRVVPQFLVNDF